MSKLFYLFIAFAVTALLTSCGPSPEETMSKIKAGEKLERADYETAAAYVIDVCDELTALMDDGFDDPDEHADRVAALSIAEQTYPYFIEFGRALYQAPDDSEAKDVIKDMEVTSHVLMLAGMPERRKESLAEDWRSPLLTFNRHKKGGDDDTYDAETCVIDENFAPELDYSWEGGAFAYDGVQYNESPDFGWWKISDKEDNGIEFKLAYEFIAADGSTAPMVVLKDRQQVIPLRSVRSDSKNMWRFKSDTVNDPSGDYIICLELFDDGYGNPAWNAKYYLWDADRDRIAVDTDVYLDKID